MKRATWFVMSSTFSEGEVSVEDSMASTSMCCRVELKLGTRLPVYAVPSW